MTRSLPPSSLPPEKRFAERRFDGPRRVKNGLKLSSREGPVARSALASQWMTLIESHVAPEAMQQGLEYARSGQIVSMQTLVGEIDARVQGTAARAYVVRVMLPSLTEQQWDALIESMAREAIHVAKLLAGELPPGLDQLFAQQGAALLPQPGGIRSTCTCPSGASGGCKHVAAVAHLLADLLSDRPLLIFTVLGQPVERLVERLRQARVLHTHGVASAHGEAMASKSTPTLPAIESQVDDFWRGSTVTDDADAALSPELQHVPHALLRRLGTSPLAGRFPMVGLLASIYDAVADAARLKRDESVEGDQQPSDAALSLDTDGDASDDIHDLTS